MIGTSHIDENGHLTNTFDLPIGTYYYKEVQTNNQYQLDTTEYDFEIGYHGSDIKEYTIEINGGEPIHNELKRGSIEIIKTTKDQLFYTKEEQAYADSLHVMDDNARIYQNSLTKDKTNYLAGVAFEIATDEAFTNIIDTKKTNGNGRIIFEQLELGTYYIREKATLQHYVLTDEMFKVELTKHEQYETIEVDNKLITSYVDVKKVDYYDHSKVLPYAGFTLYADEACTKAMQTIKTDKDGIAHFDDIKFGTTVYIKETSAPAGYELSDEVIKVTINDEWINDNKETRIIIYPDRPLTSDTVKTGDNTNILMNIMVLTFSGGFLIFMKRRKETI